MKTLAEQAQVYREAARAGVRTIREVLGRPADPDVELYERLTPQHFEAMVREYGIDDVTRYVQHMEHARLTAGRQR